MLRISVLRQCWVVVILLLSVADRAEETPADSSPLITTDSRLKGGTLIGADADWNWTFKSADGSQTTVPARKVVRYGSFAVTKGGHRLRLRSGGEILGYAIAIDDRNVAIESDLFDDALELPRGSVAAVIFDMPTDETTKRTLEKRVDAAASDGDTLLFVNGDQLVGHIVGLSKDKLTFKTVESDVLVDRSRTAAIVFARGPTSEKSQQALKTWVGLRDGSRVLADTLVVTDGLATIALPAEGRIVVKPDAVIALQPIGGDTVYLSDLKDAGYRHIPFLSLPWVYRLDSNVVGGPLIVDKRLHLKGLGMHSAARITYNLDGEYRAFQSELAIDDSTGGRGSVNCRVFTDGGNGKWQLKFESPVIRGGNKPLSVDVELAGAKRISLLVDFADRGDELDHLDWLDARLVK
jgi:NPCBM/NEW2 domain